MIPMLFSFGNGLTFRNADGDPPRPWPSVVPRRTVCTSQNFERRFGHFGGQFVLNSFFLGCFFLDRMMMNGDMVSCFCVCIKVFFDILTRQRLKVQNHDFFWLR